MSSSIDLLLLIRLVLSLVHLLDNGGSTTCASFSLNLMGILFKNETPESKQFKRNEVWGSDRILQM